MSGVNGPGATGPSEINRQAWKEGAKVGAGAGLALTVVGIGAAIFMHELTGTWKFTALPLALTTLVSLGIAWETKGREAAKLREGLQKS